MSKKWRHSWNLLELGSFDACRNTIILMIAILGYSEVNIEVLNIGIKTVGSSDCRLGNNRNINGMLAVI